MLILMLRLLAVLGAVGLAVLLKGCGSAGPTLGPMDCLRVQYLSPQVLGGNREEAFFNDKSSQSDTSIDG